MTLAHSRSAEAIRVAPPSYVALCNLHEVQIVLDDRPSLTALGTLDDALPPLGKRPTTIVLGIPADAQDEQICGALAATLPFADSYVLYNQGDDPDRDQHEAPYLACEEIPTDRTCVFASTPRDALRRAWQRAQPGERLVLIGAVADEALQMLPLCPEVMGGEVATLRAMLAHSAGSSAGA